MVCRTDDTRGTGKTARPSRLLGTAERPTAEYYTSKLLKLNSLSLISR